MARILIVDDDQKYCKMLSYLFSSRGYETRSVNSGEEAIAVMEGRAADVPGVVIVDVMMRGMSGYDTIVKLKDIVNMEHTGIIVISGLIGEVVRRRFEKLGVDEFIEKPFRPSELVQSIKGILEVKGRTAMPEYQSNLAGVAEL